MIGMVRWRWAPLLQAVTSALFVGAACWLAAPFDAGQWALAIAGVLIVWPLFEWAVHRVLLHGATPAHHHTHHVDPQGDLSVMPPMIETVLLLVFAAMVAALGWRGGAALFAGFAFGYGLYNDVHWCLHAGYWPRGRGFDAVARRHAVHHGGADVNYNVLLPVGDWLFGTYRSAAS